MCVCVREGERECVCDYILDQVAYQTVCISTLVAYWARFRIRPSCVSLHHSQLQALIRTCVYT